MPAPLSAPDLELVVTAASLAPSILNVQPWAFVARDDVLELHLDGSRRLPVLDPDGRGVTLSCGAALLNLRLALGHVGRDASVQLADEVPGSLLATVRVKDERPATPAEETLYAAIPTRRTTRSPFVDRPVAEPVLRRLRDAAAVEGATLHVLHPFDAYSVAQLVHEADREQRWDPQVRDEVRRWVRTEPEAVDGIPVDALGPAAYDPSALVRDFAFGAPVEGRPTTEYEPRPTLAVLSTERDSVPDWLRAGMALERAWLEAEVAGVSMSLLMQPLELPRLRWLARPSGTGPGRVQALLRLGVTTRPTPPTPRRPLPDILTLG